MNDKALPVTAILISLVAIGLALTSKQSEERGAARSPALDRIESRLQHLETRIARAGSAGPRENADLANPGAPEGSVARAGSLAELSARQDQLVARLTQLGVLEHFEAYQQGVTDSHAAALDPERSTKDRLSALSVLREAGRIDGEVVSSMMTVWNDSLEQDGENGKGGGWTRWAILENLEGVADPQFRDNILEWLPNEESAKMRGRAIRTLAPMMPDPVVEGWLVHLSENDPEPRIRQYAADTRAGAAPTK